jgi:predicted lipid-binding transport protein (Tim44 family)
VSSTILMAIVLVIMWLVVLVPMFVSRGDERAEARSMDRFATAMRVLSRRTPGSGGVANRRRPTAAPPAPYADGASPVRTAARVRMLRRRRRTLGVLAATALVGVPAALTLSPLLWLAQLPATILLAGYVGWLRAQVRREQDRRVRRAALFGDTATPAEHAARRPARPVGTAPAPAAATADRTWHPVPVPAPTYVTAPVVRRRAETMIDLDDDDLSFTDLDPAEEYYEDRPRAVNE